MDNSADVNPLQYFAESSADQKLQILQHEMITPIASIQGAEQLLRKMDLQVVNGSREELEFLLDVLAGAANHLKNLLELLMENETSG